MRFAAIVVALIALCAAGATGQSLVPEEMTYQGYLTDVAGTPVADGMYNIIFNLYDQEFGGAVLWTETHPTVPVTKGLFSVVLGRGNPAHALNLPFASQLFLGIAISPNPELSPRVRLATTAYSFRARIADGVKDGSVLDAGIGASANIAASKLHSSVLTEAEIVAGSGVTVNNAGGVLTIAASGGAVTLAGDVTGPAASNVIANNAVTAAKILPDIVSSISGVSNDGGNINLVAGANVTITPDDAANTVTIAASGGGGGLSLPFTGSTNGSAAPGGAAFNISQTGTGRAAYFKIDNAANVTDAFWVATNGTNTAADGARFTAVGGNAIECFNDHASTPTIYAYNNGGGTVAQFGTGGTSSADIVKVTKNGGSGHGINMTYGGTGSAMYVDNNSTGTGIELRQDGTGKAAYFHIENTSSTENAVLAETKGTSSASDALQAKAAGGRAIYGESASNSGYSTIYSHNSKADGGGAYFGLNNSIYPTMRLRNSSSTANAVIIEADAGVSEVFTVDKEGDINTDGSVSADAYVARNALGATATPANGGVYQDNVVYAWAHILTSGSPSDGFGLTSSKTATGTYVIQYKNSLTNGYAPIVTVMNSATPQFATIASGASSTGCTVYIWGWNGTTFVKQDSVFFFALVGRP